MKKCLLKDCVSFIPGINTSRIDVDSSKLYDQYDFMHDFYLEDYDVELIDFDDELPRVKEGDVIISSTLQQATIVRKDNNGKVISSNFIKVCFDTNFLDKEYFVYLFNSYSDIKRQKEKMLQGNGSVFKIPVKSLGELVIPLISLDEQHKIGKTYFKMIYLYSCLNKYQDLIKKCVGLMLDETVRRDINE